MSPGALGPRIELRPVQPEDAELLLAVYAGTRAEELAPVPWSEAEKAAFLRQQFAAQASYWEQHFPEREFAVVVVDGAAAGRLYLAYLGSELRIVDIALLPGARNRGVGTRLLEDVLARADRERRPVTIHVEKMNPALALYRRLGFEPCEDRGVYWFLQRPAAAGSDGGSQPNTAS